MRETVSMALTISAYIPRISISNVCRLSLLVVEMLVRDRFGFWAYVSD